jgi:hypothetical protein
MQDLYGKRRREERESKEGVLDDVNVDQLCCEIDESRQWCINSPSRGKKRESLKVSSPITARL